MQKAKERMAQTRKAIASTASKTADKIKEANIKEKTKAAMTNLKDRTVDAKNSVVEKSRDLKQKLNGSGGQRLSDDDENNTNNVSLRASTDAVATIPVDIERTKVFSVTVEEACNRSANYYVYLPDVVFKCLAYLWEKGTTEEGIFRLSGSNLTIQKLRSSFDQGIDVDLSEIYDPHAISGLLKLYFRELPMSLVPGNVCSGPDKLNNLRRKIEDEMLPVQRCILGNLMRLLRQVSKNEAKTRMSVSNLVIVFVPTLNAGSDIVALLISHADELFSCEPFINFASFYQPDEISDPSFDDVENDSSYSSYVDSNTSP